MDTVNSESIVLAFIHGRHEFAEGVPVRLSTARVLKEAEDQYLVRRG